MRMYREAIKSSKVMSTLTWHYVCVHGNNKMACPQCMKASYTVNDKLSERKALQISRQNTKVFPMNQWLFRSFNKDVTRPAKVFPTSE